jgi:dolichol-phosphate mannosyltransferase
MGLAADLSVDRIGYLFSPTGLTLGAALSPEADWAVALAAGVLLVLVAQVPAIAVLLSRLLRGPGRQSPLKPGVAQPRWAGAVSVIVPTLNEAARLQPCLDGLMQQSQEVREILVVDSRSQDGTPDLVQASQPRDARLRLMQDDPLPPDWVGRPWALHSGFLASSPDSEWILGMDADTQPQPGLVSSLLAIAEQAGYDLITLSPRFILSYPGEIWLQPALLMTLVYRFGPSGEVASSPERVMANGQCFFCRRSLLSQVGGYASARQSFCDDVTLARTIAATGAKVAFLDGANVYKVRMYEGAAETWREWGRSLDLKDAASPAQIWGDWLVLLAVQGLPLPLTLLLGYGIANGITTGPMQLALGLNAGLVIMRFALNWAIAPSYDLSQAKQAWLFWLSPLADPLAVLRILLSSMQRPKSWRGRVYGDN